jgi:predicted ArsR family transcriptional regulator
MFLGRRPHGTGLEIAEAVGITERAARRIVSDLHAAGYVEREKVGRRNHYRIDVARPFGRIGEAELTVGQLLDLVHGAGEVSGQDPGTRS